MATTLNRNNFRAFIQPILCFIFKTEPFPHQQFLQGFSFLHWIRVTTIALQLVLKCLNMLPQL